jgi:hypothetical protein
MAVNTNFNAQSTSSPVEGGYAQPAAGITEQIVTPADPSGNAYATALASSGTANLQISQYRDSIITVNAGGTAAAPGIGATVATITPGTAGLWEVFGTIGVAGTAIVAQADSNNMQLAQSGTARVSPLVCNATAAAATNVTISPTILNLGASDTVQVLAIRAATAATIYSANLVARRVG